MSGNNLWCRKCRSHHHPTDDCSHSQREEHILKTWPVFFQATLEGRKTFELRNCSEEDRFFQAGDTLRLVEWDHAAQEYTGRALECSVTYVMDGGRFGLPTHLCVMSIADVRESHAHLDNRSPTGETP